MLALLCRSHKRQPLSGSRLAARRRAASCGRRAACSRATTTRRSETTARCPSRCLSASAATWTSLQSVRASRPPPQRRRWVPAAPAPAVLCPAPRPAAAGQGPDTRNRAQPRCAWATGNTTTAAWIATGATTGCAGPQLHGCAIQCMSTLAPVPQRSQGVKKGKHTSLARRATCAPAA